MSQDRTISKKKNESALCFNTKVSAMSTTSEYSSGFKRGTAHTLTHNTQKALNRILYCVLLLLMCCVLLYVLNVPQKFLFNTC